MRDFDFALGLRLRSYSIVPEVMCEQIEFEPRWIHKLGERRVTPDGRPLKGVYEINYCSFPLERKNRESLSGMIDRICDKLGDNKDFFLRFVMMAEV
jgi:hypothetical protein